MRRVPWSRSAAHWPDPDSDLRRIWPVAAELAGLFDHLGNGVGVGWPYKGKRRLTASEQYHKECEERRQGKARWRREAGPRGPTCSEHTVPGCLVCEQHRREALSAKNKELTVPLIESDPEFAEKVELRRQKISFRRHLDRMIRLNRTKEQRRADAAQKKAELVEEIRARNQAIADRSRRHMDKVCRELGLR